MQGRYRPRRPLALALWLAVAALTGLALALPAAAIPLQQAATPAASPAASPMASPAASPVATPQASPAAVTIPDGDPAHAGQLPGPAPEGTIGLRWSVEQEGEPGIPVPAGDLLLLRAGSTLTAYTLADGSVAWTYEHDGPISDPFVANGMAYIADKSRLLALDATSGGEVWTTNLAFGRASEADPALLPEVPPHPVVAEGVVYVLSGTLAYGIDAATGDYVWRYDMQGTVARTPPTVSDAAVIFGSTTPDGVPLPLGLGRENGQPVWPVVDPGFRATTELDGFVADGDRIAAWRGADPNLREIVVLGDSTGVVTWSASCPTDDPEMAIVEGHIVATCAGRLVAFDIATGEPTLILEQSPGQLIGAIGAEIALTSAMQDGTSVGVVNAMTAEPTWTFRLPPTVEGAPDGSGTVVNGVVALVTRIPAAAEGATPSFTLTAIGGTEGTFGAPLPFAANPPAAGTFQRIVSPAELRAAPSAQGAILAELQPNDQVLITGAIEVVDGVTWWEIDDPMSGETGWVEPKAFEPLPGA